MFCWNCGAELPMDAKVCGCCGSPAINRATFTPTQDKTDENTSEEQILTQMEADEGSSEEHMITQDEGNESSPEELSRTQDEPVGDSPEENKTTQETEPLAEDLMIRKDRIALVGSKLLVNGQFYLKKRRRFKKKKGQLTIPLSVVTGTSMFHSHCLGKAVASLILIIIFTIGAVAAGYLSVDYKAYLDAPFLQERILELESSLSRLDGSAQTDLVALDRQLAALGDQLSQTKEELTDYEIQRNQERLRRAVSSLSLDYSAVLSDEFFAKAYDQYMNDLLQAFKNDSLLDSWLYPYYTYSLTQGTNRYISEQNNLDMWFYNIPEEKDKYVDGMKDVAALKASIQDFNLYDRLYYHGRIYITASDFMNTVLDMPNYVADSAVFVKAFGGDPSPELMSVPGWNAAAYNSFWEDAERYYALNNPIWVDYNLSAKDFALDWNQLVDEQAYYDAYIRFMDTVAPGLSTYNMVSYFGSDEAYGGMGFHVTGKEASATEMIALYLQNHPDALEQLDIDLDTIATSLDIIIAEASGNLDTLTAQVDSLKKEHSELTRFLEDGDRLRAEYSDLVQERRERSRQLTRAFVVFRSLAGLLGVMVLICLLAFIHFAKMPRHLLTLQLNKGGTVAFSTAFCSKNNLEELEKQISKLQNERDHDHVMT